MSPKQDTSPTLKVGIIVNTELKNDHTVNSMQIEAVDMDTIVELGEGFGDSKGEVRMLAAGDTLNIKAPTYQTTEKLLENIGRARVAAWLMGNTLTGENYVVNPPCKPAK